MNKNTNNTNKIALIVALTLISAACSHTATSGPTHAWNADNKTSAEYRLDNFACLNSANTNEDDLVVSDARFDDYKRCMLDRGYALRTY